MRAREAEEFMADSGVDGEPDPVAVDVSLLTEYQPNGSNICFIHNWGIGSILRYLREDLVTEPAGRQPHPVETIGTELAEAVGYHHRVLDQQTVVPIEPEVAARPAEAADRHLPASEQRVVISVRPWVEEIAMEPAKADKNHADLASQQTDMAGVERRPGGTTTDLVQATEPRSQPAEEQVADIARRSRLTEGRKDGGFPEQVVRAAWRRQGGRCARCGRWLIWSHRGRDSGIGAWQSHHRIPGDQGVISALANCMIFCSGAANCHFNIGHGGIGWTHYAPLDDSVLLFLFDISTTVTDHGARTRPKRSLLRAVLGISQPERAKKRPSRSVDRSSPGI
jgi:5-methylcytosine-specific restriction endonuclease McrA